jgi:hypothetical protein
MKKKVLLLSMMLGAVASAAFGDEFVKNDSTMLVPELAADITVDGVVDAAWDAIPFEGMHKRFDWAATTDADYSMQFKLGWKGTMIYVLVDVTDNIIVADPTFGGHLQDFANIHFDMVLDGVADFADLNTFWYRTNLGTGDASKVDGRFDSQWVQPTEGVTHAVALKTGGAYVEFSVDVTKFEVSALAAGDVYGFDLEGGDNDDPAVAQRTNHHYWSASSEGNDWATPIGEFGMVTLSGAPTAIADPTTSMVMVYPNPASKTLFLKDAVNVSQAYIYNVAGQKVLTVNDVNENMGIDISGLTSGVYYISLMGESASTCKFIVR